MNTTRTRLTVLALLAALLAGVAIIVASSAGGTDTAKASGVDRAFTADMIPHHRSAVAMAEIARARSTRPQIQKLAEAIITTQAQEIGQMRGIDGRLAEAGVEKGSLGGGSMMGMGEDVGSLKTAKPFDRAFIDMMIPHHQSAIEMARVELAKGDDGEAKKLATAIIAAQSKEIGQMNAYRKAWFGSASPAGGVPAEK